jgi:hypothetical protein
VAAKTGRSQDEVLFDAMGETLDILRAHELDVRRIAGELMRCRRLRGAKLAGLLPKACANAATSGVGGRP